MEAALDFFSGSRLDKAYISSLLVLIPKSTEISNWKDFKSINLTNVKMKFLTKILVNRLRNLLPNIISHNQTSFVPFHTINSGNRGTNIALKLDLEKAYDRVEWKFMMKMLSSLGFSAGFCNIIYNSISNSWFFILINGQQSDFFQSTRGLRQGDLLSPIIFILLSEVLSRGLVIVIILTVI
ncbi:hypothetical protein AXF42_Ash010601 [Apostasia shenzhenica]|uniref:Reverse transcriptase domain-containing protein n=1 Tax=Apostasia shenzhenica TaxID=1088818 RepID=A0A2I0A6J2_9ASPA|nr:hypothetical protein AXF42_Ash010601 [Apostasia shenzhenica]